MFQYYEGNKIRKHKNPLKGTGIFKEPHIKSEITASKTFEIINTVHAPPETSQFHTQLFSILVFHKRINFYDCFYWERLIKITHLNMYKLLFPSLELIMTFSTCISSTS